MKRHLIAILSLIVAQVACGGETPAAEAKPWPKFQYKSEGIEIPAASAVTVQKYNVDSIPRMFLSRSESRRFESTRRN